MNSKIVNTSLQNLSEQQNSKYIITNFEWTTE